MTPAWWVLQAVVNAPGLQLQDAELAQAIDRLARAVEQMRPGGGLGVSETVAVIGAVVALGTFCAGLWQYSRAQQVERAKFAVQAIEQFESDLVVRNATLMLDWDGRRIQLLTNAGGSSADGVTVTHEMLAHALRVYGPFTVDEAAIRDTFDRLFYQLGRFEHLINSRLIAQYDLRPYLAYWCDALAGRGSFKGRAYTEAVAIYMKTYGFEDAQKLVERFKAPGR